MARNDQPLSEQEVQDALAELSGWSLDDGKLHKSFKFKDFGAALGWMVRVGLEAEKLDHHPDWCNAYNRVDVHLLTHSAGALTELDVKLAKKMDSLV
ncbi:MAG: 4a-hydroxytetrahydrobiopterin dehydratase [Chloroflexi bacterium]|jgi:4a-hydroxytetrahydrobiopterin dehydratase|nr:4a-hydroxytetrahydrobiopterin dehydratase [Chloroflexota bacterium]